MVDKKYTADIQAIAKRIKLLVQRDDLSRTAIAVLKLWGDRPVSVRTIFGFSKG